MYITRQDGKFYCLVLLLPLPFWKQMSLTRNFLIQNRIWMQDIENSSYSKKSVFINKGRDRLPLFTGTIQKTILSKRSWKRIQKFLLLCLLFLCPEQAVDVTEPALMRTVDGVRLPLITTKEGGSKSQPHNNSLQKNHFLPFKFNVPTTVHNGKCT